MRYDHFEITGYTVFSDSVSEEHTILLLGDLHEAVYGPDNSILTDACRKICPDLILCSGDMITAGDSLRTDISLNLYKKLAETAPVFASFGNHETKLRHTPQILRDYLSALRKIGVQMLRNKSASLTIGADRFRITGLELRPVKYKKLRVPKLSASELEEQIGKCRGDAFEILLAHNPVFAAQYMDWGADLIVSGHYHGGLMRFGKHGSLVSPYFRPFPPYGYGMYERSGSVMIVTSGLGEHTVPLRINNPTEIVTISLKPREK